MDRTRPQALPSRSSASSKVKSHIHKENTTGVDKDRTHPQALLSLSPSRTNPSSHYDTGGRISNQSLIWMQPSLIILQPQYTVVNSHNKQKVPSWINNKAVPGISSPPIPHIISSTPRNQGAPTYPYFTAPLKLQVSVPPAPFWSCLYQKNTPRYTFFGYIYKDGLIWTWKYISKPGENKGHVHIQDEPMDAATANTSNNYTSPHFAVSEYPFFSIPLLIRV